MEIQSLSQKKSNVKNIAILVAGVLVIVSSCYGTYIMLAPQKKNTMAPPAAQAQAQSSSSQSPVASMLRESQGNTIPSPFAPLPTVNGITAVTGGGGQVVMPDRPPVPVMPSGVSFGQPVLDPEVRAILSSGGQKTAIIYLPNGQVLDVVEGDKTSSGEIGSITSEGVYVGDKFLPLKRVSSQGSTFPSMPNLPRGEK